MSHSQEPESTPNERRGTPWRWVGLAVGSVLVIGSVGAAWRGWTMAQNRLPQWLSTTLSEALQRPVEVGDLQALGPGEIRFGPSAIPATATDPDTLTLESMALRFNLLELLGRELNLTLDFDGVDAHFEQDAAGEWLALEFEPPDPDPDRPPERLIGVRVAGVTIQPRTLRISDGTLTAVPYPPTGTEPLTIAYEAVQSRVDLSNVDVEDPADATVILETQQIDFTAEGTSVQGGNLDVQGSVLLPPPAQASNNSAGPTPDPAPVALWQPERWQPITASLLPGSGTVWASAPPASPTPQVHLNLRTQEARVADVMPIVESFLDNPLPVQFPTGLVSGTVEFERKDSDPWSLQGLARVRDGTVVTGGLPEPIQDLAGDVRFQGQTFDFEGVTARMGDLTAEAGGSLDIQSGYDLAGQVDAFTLAQLTSLFGAEVAVAVEGEFVADVTMTGALGQPILTTEVSAPDGATIDQVPFAALSGRAVLDAPTLNLENLRAIPAAGGAITGSGAYRFGGPGNLTLALTADSLPADALGRPYGLPDTLTLGPVFAEASINGPVDQLTATASWRAPTGTYPARGDLRFANNILTFSDTFVQVAGGTVGGSGTLANRQWTADLTARGVELNRLGAGVNGQLTADGRLSGSLDNASLAAIQGQGTATATLPGGRLRAQGNLSGGRWTANVRGDDLQLAAFSPALQGSGSGNVALSGSTADLSLAGTRAQGQVVLSDGLATVAPVAPQLGAVQEPLVADLGWNGRLVQVQQASTAGIRVDGTITPQLQGPAAPAIDNLDLNLAVQNFSLAALPLPDLVPVGGDATFNGRLTGRPAALSLAGDANLTGLTVGELAFASPLTGPVHYGSTRGWNVDLQGGQDRILVATDQPENDLEFLVVGGDATVDGYRRGDNLYAAIDNLPLDGLKLPPGGIDGIGTVSGTIASAVIAANLRQSTFSTTFDIIDPGLGYISLQTVDTDPALEAGALDRSGYRPASAPTPPGPDSRLETRYGRMTGTVRFANDVLSLEAINLLSASGVSNYQASGTITLGQPPQVNVDLDVRNGEIQDILLTLKIFELSDFRLNPLQPPSWYRPLTPAEVADLRPNQVGDPTASLLEQIRRWAEIEELRNIQLAQRGTEPFPPLDELRGKFSGQFEARGPLSEEIRVTAALEGRNWVWGTVSNGDPLDDDTPANPEPLYRIDEIVANGTYEDQVIAFSPLLLRSTPADGTALNDPEVDAESAPADSQVASARLNGEFSLDRDDPVTRTLELEVANVPLDALRRPLRVPPNLNGDLNIGATLTGSLDNPQMRGRLRVSDATINRQAITEASANFLYKDALLNLIANLAVADNQETPLNLTASVPYQLPFATRPPATNNLRVNLQVQDEGFALVNLLTPNLTWESGEARLNLNLTGQVPQDDNFEDVLTSFAVGGEARLDGVTVSSSFLPEPLTNIRGDIRVVNDLGSGLTGSILCTGLVLDFNDVRGDFSSGEVVSRGDLKVIPSLNDLSPGLIQDCAVQAQAPAAAAPLTDENAPPATPDGDAATGAEAAPGSDPNPPAPDRADAAEEDSPAMAPTPAPGRGEPFRVSLNDIDLALKGLYNGSVEGEVVVDGALFLLEPLISGRVQLSDGTISLPEIDGTQGQPGGGSVAANASVYRPQPPTFTGFDIVLADDVRVQIAGLIDVQAQGSLDLLGTLPDVRPVGRINLPSGRVNLLTTAFRLTGGENFAEFRPGDDKIDPYLVATLATAVPDSAGAGNTLSIASPFPRNEISDAELNRLGLTQSGVETVRIRAQVDGRVSRVTRLQGVELSSTPPRSDDAIVALISGGVLTALESTIGSVSGGGDSFQGLIALAGSALLNNIQEILGDSLNVSELRLFSATPPSAQNTGEFDIGGEIGVDLSPNISVSVQKVFTNITPAVFNVRYRINENLTLRGVTSYEQFNENTGALLEIQF